MLRKLRSRLSYANVMSTVAVFLALGGVSAYAANEWTGANIVDGSLTGQDVFDNTISGNDMTNNSVAGIDIKNGSLKDEDVGKATFVNFAATIPTVGAHQCFSAPVTGTSAAEGDHLLLTASDFDSPALATANLDYSVRYGRGTAPDPELWFCNPTDGSVPGGTTHFSLLVFDAQ
jgi:hypothetical protein